MPIFTLHEIINAVWAGFGTFRELKGAFAEVALRLVLSPFHSFSLTSCFVALGWVMILWKNKGWILSGFSHILHVGE